MGGKVMSVLRRTSQRRNYQNREKIPVKNIKRKGTITWAENDGRPNTPEENIEREEKGCLGGEV